MVSPVWNSFHAVRARRTRVLSAAVAERDAPTCLIAQIRSVSRSGATRTVARPSPFCLLFCLPFSTRITTCLPDRAATGALVLYQDYHVLCLTLSGRELLTRQLGCAAHKPHVTVAAAAFSI